MALALKLSVLAVLVATTADCSSPNSSAGPCSNIPVSRFQELEIVDPAVVTDKRAMNANDGAWSFRHAVEQMAPTGNDPGEFIYNWFVEWETLSTYNGYPLYSEPRSAMSVNVLCPWATATASNGCTSVAGSGCTCTASPLKLDLSAAPFRLLAIANRMDLRLQADESESQIVGLGLRHHSGAFLLQPPGDPCKIRGQRGLPSQHSFHGGERTAVISRRASERENHGVYAAVKIFHVEASREDDYIF